MHRRVNKLLSQKKHPAMPPQFKIQNLLKLVVKHRWIWHLVFWVLYAVFQARSYYVTIKYYDVKYLEFMLISQIPYVIFTYLTIWSYEYLISKRHYVSYILTGIILWSAVLFGIVTFQKYYLHKSIIKNIIHTMSTVDNIKNCVTNYYYSQCLYFVCYYLRL